MANRNYDKITYLTSKPVTLHDFASYMGLEFETVKDIIDKGVITNFYKQGEELMIDHVYTAQKNFYAFIQSARKEAMTKLDKVNLEPDLKHYTLDDVFSLFEGKIIYLYKWQSPLRRRSFDTRLEKKIKKVNNRKTKKNRKEAYILLIGAIIDSLVYRKICRFF